MLEIYVQKLGKVIILRLSGRIAIGETSVLLNAAVSDSDATAVVLDMDRIKGVDAHGLGVLLVLRELTQSKGIEFRLMNVPRVVRQVLEITCLNTVFEEYSTEGNGLRAFDDAQPRVRPACN